MLVKFDGIIVPRVFAVVVDVAEPAAFVAVNWTSYDVPAARPVIVVNVAFAAGAVAVIQSVVPATRYSNVYPVRSLCAVHISTIELIVAVQLAKFAGAVGAATLVITFTVDAAVPAVFVAVNWNSYDVFAARPLIVALVAFAAGAVAVVHVLVPATRYCNVYPVRSLCAFHESVTEFAVCAVLVKPAGAVGADVCVVTFVVEEAEPFELVAVNWKSYVVFADRPLIVAFVAFVAGAVAVVHVLVPATRYCNVYPVRSLCAFHESVTEFAVCAVLVKLAGAVGAATLVAAFAVDTAEPAAFVAVNWKSYDVFAASPVIVALVAFAAGAVAVVHVLVPATRYCNV